MDTSYIPAYSLLLSSGVIMCYGLHVPYPRAYVEILMPHVMVLRGGPDSQVKGSVPRD